MPNNMTVVVEGIAETRRALNKFAPEVRKALDKSNKELAQPLIGAAKSNVVDSPLSNWAKPNGWMSNGRDLSFNAATVRRGIKVKQRGRSRRDPFSSVMSLFNDSAAGSIYETAGRKTAGGSFVNGIQRWYHVNLNSLSRVVWKAVFKDVGTAEIVRQVLDNYAEAEKWLQKALDRNK